VKFQNLGLVLLSFLFWGSLSQAALTLSAVGGTSAASENFLTIYGGLGGTCATTNSTSTCNSCTGGGTGFEICNQRRIHDSLNLTLTFAIDSTESAGTGVRVSLVQSTDNAPVYESPLTDIAVNTTTSVSIPWSQICSNFGVACNNPGSAVNTSKTFYFGVDKNIDGIPDEAARITLTIRLMNPDASAQNSTDCGATDQVGQGLCFFSVERGDEKAYISDFAVASDYPAVASMSGNSFVAAYFYIGEFDTDATTTVAGIRNNNSAKRIPLVVGSTGSTPTLSDNRIDGLQNDTQYCFVSVNEDIAGNLFRASALTTGVCATPEPVVGLLDDKKCFIATASFGDADMQPVVVLRQFRDRFLKSSALGQKFVKIYYSMSPGIADFIANSPVLKVLVKAALVPAVIVADLMLLGQTALLFALLLATFFASLVWMKGRRA
jgi:hypothetical protein